MINVEVFQEKIEHLKSSDLLKLDVYNERIEKTGQSKLTYIESIICETIRPTGTYSGVS